jgi:hypothetical protein
VLAQPHVLAAPADASDGDTRLKFRVY